MKFKTLILFVCFSAISANCFAYEGMTETGAEFVIAVFKLLCATVINCLLIFILPIIPWRNGFIFGNIWIAVTSTVLILIHTVWLVREIDVIDKEGWLIHLGYLTLNIILFGVSLRRLIKKLYQN